MKNAHKKYYFLIASVAALVLSVLAYVAMYKAVHSAYDEALLAEAKVEAGQKTSTEGQKVITLYEETKQARQKIENSFVPDDKPVAFIEALEALSNKTDSAVSLSAVSADDTTNLKPGSLAKINAKVDFGGSWRDVMKVLSLAEVMPFRTEIKSVRLESSTADSVRYWRLSFSVGSSILKEASSTPNNI